MDRKTAMEKAKNFGRGVANTARVVRGTPVIKPHIESGRPPFVFVSGILGTGEYSSFEHILPYWGLFHGDLLARLEGRGFACYAAAAGPVNSAWDRACELYAQLAGGRVDYGQAHSQNAGHERFGRSYEPMFQGWGEERPVHLIGHSFGGATCRQLAQLLAEGSGEERAATPAGELSPLFAGGNLKRVLSLTCLAAPHNGTTAICAIQKSQRTWTFLPVYGFLSLVGTIPVLNGLYDVHLEHFGMSNPTGQFRGNHFSRKRLLAFLASRDHATADLSLDGAAQLNARCPIRPELLYYSFACTVTRREFRQRRLPPLKELKDPLLDFFSVQMGLGLGWAREEIKHILDDGRQAYDPFWLENDGAVPLASGLYPFGQPCREFDPEHPPADEDARGIWNVMPVRRGADHGYYCGWDPNHPRLEGLVDFYTEHFQRLERAFAPKEEELQHG